MSRLITSTFGYIKLTGKYKTYNGYTCAVGKAVKVSSQSGVIQKKIDKKETILKKYKGMLNDRVVFYKSELSDDSAFVIQVGVKERLPWIWNAKVVGLDYNYEKYNSVKWKSSNPEIVSVNSKGEVTAKKEGTVTISATCALSKITTKLSVVVVGKPDNGDNRDDNYNNYNYSSMDYINFVKQSVGKGYGFGYGDEITYGEAFSYFFTNPTWDYFKASDGNDVVEFTGGCLKDGEDMIVCMQFIVDMKNKKYQINWLDFDGEEQNDADLDNLLATVFSAYDA
ncbi:MAG: hypothetical protein HFH72_05475 [Lachnospiraceae bacterium]|nr:hypothetical protein [Lachnospiraceae bacterium]